VNIEIEGLAGNPALRGRILAQMDKALSRMDTRPATAVVNFTDVNGPKGGVDQRCGLTVRLPGRRTVHVEETATSRSLAFTAAADALERWIRKEGERANTERRRPKKYYVAKRLLVAEPGTLAPEGSPSRRRQRRAASL
jgi:ribosome-associated translation inhibitor RaiA